MGVSVTEHIEWGGNIAYECFFSASRSRLVEQCLFWSYSIGNLEAAELAVVEHVMELNVWKYSSQHFGDEVTGGS
jgi:hypothetical protein